MRTLAVTLFFAAGLLTSGTVAAQSKKVTFTGAGRLLLSSDRIQGELLEESTVDSLVLPGDTVTARREMTGYALFDLGFDIRPNSQTEIRAITRITSDLDGFWGAGISFNVRELYARGLIRNVVRYRIGDIDVKATPYTLWNNNRDLGISQASALAIFGDIIDYEMFYTNNRWRQQGAELDFALMLPKLFDEIEFRGLISKNRNTDYFSLPDRMFAMGQLNAVNEEHGKLGYVYTRLFEVPASAQFSESFGTSDVHSIQVELTADNPLNARLEAEAGFSQTWYRETFGAPNDTSGAFMDVAIRGEIPQTKWQFRLGYRSVESGFRSAGAQSRRLNVGRTPEAFSFIGNNEVARPLGMVDVLKDPTLYNLTFGPELTDYNPAFENAEPYGRATPNRQGATLELGMQQDSSLLADLHAEAGFLTELSGRGIDARRNFNYLRLGAGLAIAETLGWENDLDLTLGLSYQQTSRDGLSGLGEGLDGIGEVDLTGTFAEIGLAAEITDGFDLVAAGILFAAEGNEYMPIRDGFNTITDYTESQIDHNETLLAVGLRYRFSNQIQLTVQQHMRSFEDGNDPSRAFDMNQFVVLYNMFF